MGKATVTVLLFAIHDYVYRGKKLLLFRQTYPVPAVDTAHRQGQMVGMVLPTTIVIAHNFF